MNITAFMQNPWFQPGTPESVILKYRDDQKFHREILAATMSGQRLLKAFGERFFEIHWDNTNWIPAEESDGVTDPDPVHIMRVVHITRPKLILCIGSQASKVMASYSHIPQMHCHHPNARGKTQTDLVRFAIEVEKRLLEMELLGQPLHFDLMDDSPINGRGCYT